MMHGGYFHGWWMPWGWVIGLVMLIAIIWLITRTLSQNQGISPSSPHRSPMDILKERYAKGEINKKEFEEKKKDLA